jgi:hypothetical protein
MRTRVLAAAASTVLGIGLLSPPAAHAAVNTYVIAGHPITKAPGMALLGDSCSTSGATPPTVNTFERDGGTLGTSALGWSVAQANYEAGPVATLAGNPDNLNAYHVDVLAPTGTTGHAYARINWDADTWYIGWAAVDVPAGGWRPLDLVGYTYSWTLYDAGTVTDYDNAFTVQEFVTGPGFQAVSLGVLLGCGGEQFFVDRMVVGNAENSSTYDFEKTPPPPPLPPPPPPPPPPEPMAQLDFTTDGSAVRTGDEVVVRYGQQLWMLGHGHLHTSTGDSYYGGAGTLVEEPTQGAKRSYRDKFDPTYYAAFKVEPTQKTIYQFTSDPYQGLPAVSSARVRVLVQSRIRARLLDRGLVEGQRLSVKGSIAPERKGVQVRLQRRVDGHWTKLAATRTGKGGRFSLSTVARKPGRWTVRVSVATTQLNLGAFTKSATVTVKRYVPPPRHTPPPPQSTTPTTPTTVSTPEPTEVSTEAPQPPPRPTNTGRTTATAATPAITAVAGAEAKGDAPVKP